MFSFKKKESIGNYVVTFPVKEGAYAETYRVKDNSGKNYFLKLINCSKLHRTQFSEFGEVLEIQLVQNLHHENITKLVDSGEVFVNGHKMELAVFEYISGETVAEKVTREQRCSVDEAKRVVKGVLFAAKYLHELDVPIIHNELTIQNVMLDLMAYPPTPKLIDFGYARYLTQGQKSYQKEGINPFYMAPEAYHGVYSVQSDIFSAGAMLYHLLFGIPPYFVDLPGNADEVEIEDAIMAARQRPLQMPDLNSSEFNEQLVNTICKALATHIDDRFKSADEFIKALDGEIKVEAIPLRTTKPHADNKTKEPQRNIRKGNGFADVAGMRELKEQLQSDVIDLLNDPEQAKALGLSIPNGLLFYGPPGCGKTYFAEKFAEEAACNYMYVRCSDVASPYIHGGQGKIAAVFDEARKNAPTILFLDEIDAMIRSRNKQDNASMAGEVNEFLTQLNNCGACGVIVIGATNKPTEIDEAALRSGRLELKYYIPNPDLETRMQLFKIQLKDRKVDFGLDYEHLAKLTENYISADIKLVVDTAARLVFRRKLGKITMSVLEEAIKDVKPSISLEALKQHEMIRDQFEVRKRSVEPRRKIGF